jgi:hypothetical protein
MHILALIGAATIATLVIREARYQWKTRNWKPTPWLCLPR